MVDRGRLLVVAATTHELAPADGWRTLVCGVGPVEAAVATASEIARDRPALVLHVGIAGARRQLALAPGTLVIGSEARYSDLGVRAEWAPSRVMSAPRLVDALQQAIPVALTLPIGTSARVGGTTDCDIEAMEGFAVLRAAALAGVSAIEVRAISNEIEETDRARWHFDVGFAAIQAATPAMVRALLPHL
ncbi:MAG: hypothetical protein K2X99_11935 [Gemmatimonadaceae bacterium]|nr:hypothetical protein [Gemmatimonadaceae bacterium]